MNHDLKDKFHNPTIVVMAVALPSVTYESLIRMRLCFRDGKRKKAKKNKPRRQNPCEKLLEIYNEVYKQSGHRCTRYF